jgi:hypothetical protein
MSTPDRTETTKHECEGERPFRAYGPAITDCSEDETGRLWAGNIEYSSSGVVLPVLRIQGA